MKVLVIKLDGRRLVPWPHVVEGKNELVLWHSH